MLAPLLVLALLAAAVAPRTGPGRAAASAPTYQPWCLVDDPNVPDEAYTVEEFARTHNYSPPPGLAGGRQFADDNHLLPALLRPFKEYDVYPAVPGGGRPPQRIVLSNQIPFASWYSPNHYDNFVLMFPLGCATDPQRWVPGGRLPGGGP